jgi:hypothetical protein
MKRFHRTRLTGQWFKVPLIAVNADRKRVDQVEALGVLGQHRGEVVAEGHVGTDKHPQARGQANTNRFVVP